MMMTPKEKPLININTIFLTTIVILFTFFSMASSKWIERIEEHISANAAWAQNTEVRLAKVESCQAQTLEALAEIKQILKSRPTCQPPS